MWDRETQTWQQDDDVPEDPNQRESIESHAAVVVKKKLFVVGGQRFNKVTCKDELSNSVMVFNLVTR
jgi:hypothetical protein